MRPAVLALAFLAAGFGLGMWLRPAVPELQPKLHRVTFSRLTILTARFTPDGNLIMGLRSTGDSRNSFFAQRGSVESRPDSHARHKHTGGGAFRENWAVQSPPDSDGGIRVFGNVGAVRRKEGGAPRSIADRVEFADWGADRLHGGSSGAFAGKNPAWNIPLGKILYERRLDQSP